MIYQCIATNDGPLELHPELKRVIKDIAFVDKVRHNGQAYSVCLGGGDANSPMIKETYQGLHTRMKKLFFPPQEWDVRRRNKWTKKQGSSLKLGKAVERAIDKAVFNNNGKKPRKMHALARKVLDVWEEELGHDVQVAQLPVVITGGRCCTQGDYFTVDRETGELWLWELKTGWPVIPRKPVNFLNLRLSPSSNSGKKKRKRTTGIPCTPFNKWELQRLITHMAYEKEMGMKIARSRVIHVWKEHVTTPFNPKGSWVAKHRIHEPSEWANQLGDDIYSMIEN